MLPKIEIFSIACMRLLYHKAAGELAAGLLLHHSEEVEACRKIGNVDGCGGTSSTPQGAELLAREVEYEIRHALSGQIGQKENGSSESSLNARYRADPDVMTGIMPDGKNRALPD